MANWQQAKARRQSEQMIAEGIKFRNLVHGFTQEQLDVEFNLCKSYACGAVIFDTKYTWCEDCRNKYEKRPLQKT